MALHEDLSLDVLLDKARLQEASEEQAKGIDSVQSADTVNLLESKRPVRKWQPARLKPEGQSTCRAYGYGLLKSFICICMEGGHLFSTPTADQSS